MNTRQGHLDYKGIRFVLGLQGGLTRLFVSVFKYKAVDKQTCKVGRRIQKVPTQILLKLQPL
jgi:hypothetical protein